MSDTSKTPLADRLRALGAIKASVFLGSISIDVDEQGVAALVAEQLAEVQAQRDASNREIERLRDALEAAKRRVAKLEDLRQEYMGIIEQQAAELDARDFYHLTDQPPTK